MKVIMKYWTLYWKDIDKMTKEELKQHLVKTLEQYSDLSEICHELRLKNFELEHKPKNFLQKLLWI